jgi:hypothetical protein
MLILSPLCIPAPLQMHCSYIPPGLIQILGHQPAVAPLGRRLAAQQDRAPLEPVAIQLVLDLALGHQLEETLFVLSPRPLTLLVVIEERLGGSQQRLVVIVDMTQLTEEEFEIVALGEAGQLGDVVEPYVDELLDAGAVQGAEELSGTLPRKTDRVDLNGRSPVPSPNRVSCELSLASRAARSASVSNCPSPLIWDTSTPRSRNTLPMSRRRWHRDGFSSLQSKAMR